MAARVMISNLFIVISGEFNGRDVPEEVHSGDDLSGNYS